MNVRSIINPDGVFALEGRNLIALIKVMDRLYDDSKPLAVDERRDLAQCLHAQLEHVCAIDPEDILS